MRYLRHSFHPSLRSIAIQHHMLYAVMYYIVLEKNSNYLWARTYDSCFSSSTAHTRSKQKLYADLFRVIALSSHRGSRLMGRGDMEQSKGKRVE